MPILFPRLQREGLAKDGLLGLMTATVG